MMKTTLLIEDESTVREMVRTFIELQNYSVITESDRKDGFELAKRIVPI